MKKIRAIFFILHIGLFLTTCGGGTSPVPPSELPSIKIGGSELSAGETVDLSAVPSDFSLAFQNSVDPSSVTTDKISISCLQEDIEISISESADTDGIENNEYLLTPTEGVPQQDTCILTLSGTLLSQNMQNPFFLLFKPLLALAADDAQFGFTTPCASELPVIDSFQKQNTFSDNCWFMTTEDTNSINPVVDSDAGNVEFLIASSTDSDVTTLLAFSNILDLGDNIQYEIKVTDFEGVVNSGTIPSNHDGLEIALHDPSGGNTQSCGLIGNGGDGIKFHAQAIADGVAVFNFSTNIGTGASLDTVTGGYPIFLRLTKNLTQFVCSYRVGTSGDFTDINSVPYTADISGSGSIYLRFYHQPTNPTYFTVDSMSIIRK